MLRFTLLWLLVFFLSLSSSSARPAPFAMRISCGARENVQTPPTYARWYKDFAYTGGIPANATLPSFITPPLKSLRYFPLSEGPENCYNIDRVPKGHYSVRIFFGLVAQPEFDNEPLFDVSVEGTLIHSLNSGWTSHDDQVFAEALVFLLDGTVSICFHSTGHGDPAIISIEILQVDDKAYFFGPEWGKGVILKTTSRLTCGTSKPKFDEDYSGDHWGGDRFWNPIRTFGQNADEPRSTESSIKQASVAPNFYPEALYQSAIVSTDSQPDLAYTMDVDPNKNYSLWLHFAEIDATITGAGQRVFDVLINGDTVFQDIDVVEMSGDRYTALVLNTTVALSGRTLTITLRPKNGNHAILNAIEVFEIIAAEFQTLPEEVRALQALKKALGLPNRFGWNGDPCVPKEHPWSGADCHFDNSGSNWFIDGLGLDNQGLRGFLPNEISQLHHLQNLNLSGNSIHGTIPSSLGTVTSLEILDLSYNFLNGSIPESLGQLTALRRLNLNSNSLSGRVPAALGGRLLNGASFNFTDNAGLCGIPGLRTCGPHLSAGAKVGIGFGASLCFLLLVICSVCWWKRRQNILRSKQIAAARGAPYAKARTHLSHDIQMSRHHNHGHARTAAENGPSLLS
ncbi:putative leucine-rich repeat receptor-like serine/threonine-protein kinase At2g14440 isoform X1 [Durio zibethinus]|uniref:Leucine-rich repeat receptor-like serine/threonine-protein kinase At2g14440 isoform X1 n=1 Tax=Durio zibethinus TaxID=66656 RepID=A0A6P5WWD6_DURZI|nr:putative leucine-rich repeat receptor-like serine/threonine-protein kinase At2g14440 isoform X1 [Durio zibethinus]